MAALLGVTLGAIAKRLHSLGLAATGTGAGRARRYPRATVEALLADSGEGVAPATVNHYIIALRGFGRWLMRTRRVTANPFETLAAVPTATDVRRRRRALSDDELRRLLETTRASTRTIGGLTGPDRYALYLVAASTGIRARALAGLTPRAFDLDAGTVTVPAKLSKNRKTHTVPLRDDVAAMLREYLASKTADTPIWSGSWHSTCVAAKMLRDDLRDAGIPYRVETPDGPTHVDFHALRHTFLTALGRAGVELRTAQLLAGHSSPTITARYSHRSLADLADAVRKLPSLTGDTASVIRTISVPELFVGGHSEASSDNTQTINPPSGVLPEPVAVTGFDASCHREAGSGESSPGRIRTFDPPINSRLLYR
jgi:integrase